jgi:hypothetical protein
MKSVKISWHIIIISPLIIIYLMLFVSQLGEPTSIRAFNGIFYSKSRSFPENSNLPETTQYNNFSTLIFSNPFYSSNDILMLGKIPPEILSTINGETHFFAERAIINAPLVTYNEGYYIEGSKMNGSNPDSIPLSIDLKTEIGPNYAKGSGIFQTENKGIIEWDSFDQIINKSAGKVLYAGMISFFPTANKNDELSFLKNRLGSYEFSIDYDTTTSSSAYATNSSNSTHRTIWLWPNIHQLVSGFELIEPSFKALIKGKSI